MVVRPMKYNPAFLTEEDLIASFAVREKDLELVMQTIRDNTDGHNQHLLLVGARGMGKTMLLLRAVAEVRRADDLKDHWHPVIFAEESYTVTSPGEFWLEAIFHLAEGAGDEALKRAYEDLKKEADEKRLRDRALSQLLDYSDSIRKRLLLVVENLNMLLGEQISEAHAWELRHTLLNEPRIMLLGSAITRIEAIDNHGKAMFDLFKVQKLEPLSEPDCARMWTAVSGTAPEGRQIRPIQILTGGNLRLLTIISAFAAGKPFRELMEDLTSLVDDHTDYFKSHLDALPTQERKAYLALAEIWDPAETRRIAEFARLKVNETSSQLKRLEGRGAVIVSGVRGRKKYYQLAERLYNIYYLMRRHGGPSERVRAVVKFMLVLYEGEKLVRKVRELAEEACGLQPDLRLDHYLAFESIVKTVDEGLRTEIVKNTPPEFWKSLDASRSVSQLCRDGLSSKMPSEVSEPGLRNVIQFLRKGKYELAVPALREIIAEKPSSTTYIALGFSLLMPYINSNIDMAASIFLEAEQAYKKATEIDPGNALAWECLGDFLHEDPNRSSEAEGAYWRAIGLKPDEASAWFQLGRLLHEKLNRFSEAEDAYRKVIEIDSNCISAWINLGLLLDEKLGRPSDAESAYRKATEIEPGHALVWAILGQLLDKKLGRLSEAEDAYRKAIDLDPGYADAWATLGQLLDEKLGRLSEAEEAYRKAVDLEPGYAEVWAKLGKLLHEKLGRFFEAEETYRKAIELDPHFGWVWGQLGLLLHEDLKLLPEAEQAYRKAIEVEPTAARVWAELGRLLHEDPERSNEAEQSYRKAIDLDPSYVWAWGALVRLLVEAGKTTEAFKEAVVAVEIRSSDSQLLNDLSWNFYFHNLAGIYPDVKKWSEKAILLEPENPFINHTHACILASLGECADAIRCARIFYSKAGWNESAIDGAIDLAVVLASAGCTKEALDLVLNSPGKSSLEPLIVGLQLYLGQDVKPAAEIYEVGKDVAEKIRERRKQIMSKETKEPLP